MNKIAAFATTTVLLVAASGAAASAREAEPLDDHGTTLGTVHVQPATIEAGDDHGTDEVEPGDDHGGHGSDH